MTVWFDWNFRAHRQHLHRREEQASELHAVEQLSDAVGDVRRPTRRRGRQDVEHREMRELDINHMFNYSIFKVQILHLHRLNPLKLMNLKFI